jgi:hypothetical protein
MVSNTLILTGLTDEKLNSNAFIHSLQQVLLTRQAPTQATQFIILKSFHRILIIFETHETSTQFRDIYRAIGLTEGFSCGFSLNDYSSHLNNYLELPSNSRMFLISPPASPPVDFNYDATEEDPNKLQIYTHEDIQEMLLRNNDELKQLLEHNHSSTEYVPHHHESLKDLGKEIVLSDSIKGPKIVLNPINGEDDHLIGKAIRSFRTSLPPRSIFDDLDD